MHVASSDLPDMSNQGNFPASIAHCTSIRHQLHATHWASLSHDVRVSCLGRWWILDFKIWSNSELSCHPTTSFPFPNCLSQNGQSMFLVPKKGHCKCFLFKRTECATISPPITKSEHHCPHQAMKFLASATSGMNTLELLGSPQWDDGSIGSEERPWNTILLVTIFSAVLKSRVFLLDATRA